MKPTDSLNITLVQPEVHWEDRDANLAHLSSLLEGVVDTDLIVLPEMFSTGFSMKPASLAEKMDGPSVRWMKSMASGMGAVVCGSLIIKDNASYYNRLIWMRPDGSFHTYDKRHLFSFAEEHRHYASGKDRLIVELKGWKVCPLVCYDLRFPVWSRNQDLNGAHEDFVYDLLIYVANWPEARRIPWQVLLEARAHENQAFVVGVNRVGMDGNGINHAGDSAVHDMKGVKISHINPGVETVQTCTLQRKDLDDFRAKFTPWKDKDRFDLLS